MSMAEPRKRLKWSLNPRGTIWANDESKFGQKLMEKMGWTKGSGLGREEQGIKEHLTVKFKDDNKGIGYKGSDDEWIKHYEGFEKVLASLNSQENITAIGNSDELPGHNTVAKTSLESSSKASRARVHYHKFTRGKDLSRCSDDDLGCILGSKRAKRLAEESGNEASDVVGTVQHSMGVTTIKGCSIQEYFAQKMESFRNRGKSQLQTWEEKNECGSEEECVGKPGLGVSSGGREETPDSPAVEEGAGERKKKKKKRKKQQVEVEEINCGESEEKFENCVQSENVPKKKKKKKRQQSFEFSAVNGSTGENTTVGATKKLLHNSNEDNVHFNAAGNEEPEKMKRSRKHTSTTSEEQTLKAVTMEENPKVKKKKWRHKDIVNEGDYPSHDEGNKYPEIQKKKKKKKKDKP